jgi:hypothetical protein
MQGRASRFADERRDAPPVRGQGSVAGPRSFAPPTEMRTTWWRWPASPSGSATPGSGGSAMIRRRGAHRVRLVERPAEERPQVIAKHRGIEKSGSKAAAKQACDYFGMNPNPPPEEIGKLPSTTRLFRVAYGEDWLAPCFARCLVRPTTTRRRRRSAGHSSRIRPANDREPSRSDPNGWGNESAGQEPVSDIATGSGIGPENPLKVEARVRTPLGLPGETGNRAGPDPSDIHHQRSARLSRS